MIKRLLAAALTLVLLFGSASLLSQNTFYDTASMTASAESYQQGDFVYRFYKLVCLSRNMLVIPKQKQ